jgi:heterodisulfide reductase subunit A-like polyferredoxin
MKLRPVETVIDGVTIAGTCQGPKNITESVNSALSAGKYYTTVYYNGVCVKNDSVSINQNSQLNVATEMNI